MSTRHQVLCQHFTNTLTEFSHCSVKRDVPTAYVSLDNLVASDSEQMDSPYPYYLPSDMPLRKVSVPRGQVVQNKWCSKGAIFPCSGNG